MPLYTYVDDRDGKTYDILQGMNDVHEYFLDGVKLRRVFQVPQATFDTNVNAFSEQGFVEKTGKMRGTVGDMQDYAKELSEKRGGSQDPVKRQHYKDYASKRAGKKHPDVVKEIRKERLAKLETKMGIKVTD